MRPWKKWITPNVICDWRGRDSAAGVGQFVIGSAPSAINQPTTLKVEGGF